MSKQSDCWSTEQLLNALTQTDKTKRPTNRPAKKRCQFKVVYNIPVVGNPPAGGQGPEVNPNIKPQMTANPTQCPSAAVRIAGECPHCLRVFCSAHRTPEAHKCTEMQACREQAFEANKERLRNESVVAAKIAQA
ncbi:nuclear protein [Tremella mesenterica]|uniref:Nuclear protein n=1 Tax=Tremella mesenterica TaxID=5217 RepID=A0A4Q1BWN0_TREME|nr:uncharacterized protein TREMEDRAFT_59022 [Tremella mesenterica DSM 1558]EIW72856.1 hypothetical protein TREMEDRAFT_59022 [Tremella mesenterica DSM 1558]RXK42558.1 nuclear protein [Tremella mesenterica]